MGKFIYYEGTTKEFRREEERGQTLGNLSKLGHLYLRGGVSSWLPRFKDICSKRIGQGYHQTEQLSRISRNQSKHGHLFLRGDGITLIPLEKHLSPRISNQSKHSQLLVGGQRIT